MAHPDADPDADPAAGVARPRLLHADEDRLRLVAATLARGGRFVLVVADAALWPVALELLRERLPDHTFVERAPTSSEETSQAISDPLRDAPGTTIIIRVTGRDSGPIETLNLRRESLVKAAANFLVVLEGDDAHNRFLREAPDCYSYRHLLVVLQGEPSLEAPEQIELDQDRLAVLIEDARNFPNPKERAEMLQLLATVLSRLDDTSRANKLRDEAITAMTVLSSQRELDDDERTLLAQLWMSSAERRARTERYRRFLKARELLKPIADRRPDQLANLEGLMIDAIGMDLSATRSAVHRAREGGGGKLDRQLIVLGLAYSAREDLIRVREIVTELDSVGPASLMNNYGWTLLCFNLHLGTGEWTKADRLVSVTSGEMLIDKRRQRRMDRLRAELLGYRGEHRAAQRIYELQPPSFERDLALLEIAANLGQTRDVRIQLARTIDCPPTPDGPNINDLLRMHRLLARATELEVDAKESELACQSLDERLAALRLHIERTELPDPPWSLIRCLLLQADAYLKRSGAERLAIPHAEEAWKLADERAGVLASSVARRLAVASLRLGELDRAQEWLARGLGRAGEHEHRGDEARLRGLALWHETLAGGDVDKAEAEMRAAIAATGSVLIEAAVLARAGAAIGRRDLLQRAQQIYRSLPWPEREGLCLEALGETKIAEVRYRTFGLAARLALLERRAGPPPIVDTDDT